MAVAPAGAITTIGFDADDTLWHNERLFQMTEQRFIRLLGEHADQAEITSRLLAAERRNLGIYGYGVKGFTLSMIETALEITGNRVAQNAIREILDFGQAMLRHPVETFPESKEILAVLAATHRLVLITKGDLFDQERKLAQSGLGDFFAGVEIVSEKTSDTYARIFTSYGDGPERAVMVGNSLKSDVLPALAAGAWGIHVPHAFTWALEHEQPPTDNPRFRSIGQLDELLDVVAQLC